MLTHLPPPIRLPYPEPAAPFYVVLVLQNTLPGWWFDIIGFGTSTVEYLEVVRFGASALVRFTSYEDPSLLTLEMSGPPLDVRASLPHTVALTAEYLY